MEVKCPYCGAIIHWGKHQLEGVCPQCEEYLIRGQVK